MRGAARFWALALGAGVLAGCAATGGGAQGENFYVSQTGTYQRTPGHGLVLIKTEVDGSERDYAIVLARMNPHGNGLELREGKPVTVRLQANHSHKPEFGASVLTAKNGAYHLLELPAGAYVFKNLHETLALNERHTSCLLENSVAFEVTEGGISYVGDVTFEPAIKQKGNGLLVMTHVDGPAKIIGVGHDRNMAKRFLAHYPTLGPAEMTESETREVNLPTEKTVFGKTRC